MSRFNLPGLLPGGAGMRSVLQSPITGTEFVLRQRPLQRLLAFSGHTIDEVVNSPAAKNQVLGYFKLHKWVQRRSEVVELERQWNGPAAEKAPRR